MDENIQRTFDSYMKLAEFMQQRHFNRRSLSWRGTFGIWVFVAAAPLYVTARPPELLLVLILVGVVGLHAVWINEMRRRGRTDDAYAFFYLESAEASAFPETGVEVGERPRGKFGVFQGLAEDIYAGFLPVIITTFLAMAAWYLIGSGLISD